MKNGKNAVAHLIDHYDYDFENNNIVIKGQFGWSKQMSMTPFKLIILRIIMENF